MARPKRLVNGEGSLVADFTKLDGPFLKDGYRRCVLCIIALKENIGRLEYALHEFKVDSIEGFKIVLTHHSKRNLESLGCVCYDLQESSV